MRDSRRPSGRNSGAPDARLLFVGVPVVFLIVLFIAPLSLMVAYSLWALDDNYNIVRVWNFEQYEKFFASDVYPQMLLKSARMALVTTVVSLLVAFPLAYYIVRVANPRWRLLLIVALIVPGWVSVLIRTYAWTLVIGEGGILNYLLLSIGLISEPLEILFTETAVVIGLVYIYLPYMLVPIYAALDRLDPSLLEAAENLGAGPVSRLVRIVVPLTLPGIVAGSIITFIPALGEYLVPNLLGGLQGQMYGNLISSAFEFFDWPFGAMLGMVLLVSVLALLAAVSRIIGLERVFAASR